MKPFRPDYIYIEETSLNDKLTERILEKFPQTDYKVVKDENDVPEQFRKQGSGTLTQGKRVLYLKRNKGQFIERCPGTANSHICCNYLVANIAVNCHLDCTYCFLQSYLTERYITVYTNIDDFFNELDAIHAEDPEKEHRIGTGELADSLALDELTEYSQLLVPFFAERKNLLLELKTKGNYVENLIDLDPKGNTVIAWSVNSPDIIKSEEHKCSSLESRLQAAKKCADAGYKLAFHFDPIIMHEGWEEKYRGVIDSIFEYVEPSKIEWVSLGVLRFTPAGRNAIEERFPNTKIIYGEMVQGVDGKLRYLQPQRSAIYKLFVECIKKYNPDTYTYLCMESPAVWHRVFGENSRSENAMSLF